mgnify:FL=1
MEHDVDRHEAGKCHECEVAAGAVTAWKPPFLAKDVWEALGALFGAWAVAGLLALAVRGTHDAGLPDSVLSYFAIALVAVVAAIASATFGLIVVFFFGFLPRNVFAKNRGVFLFLDTAQRLHRHLAVPIATPYAATPAIIGIGVGRWLRKTVTIGAPWHNWKVVGRPTLDRLFVEDQNWCKLPGSKGHANVLKQIAQYASVNELVVKAEARAEKYESALAYLGIHVQAVVLRAIANKDVQRSQLVKMLREELELALAQLRDCNTDLVTDATLAEWKKEAERLLEEEKRAAEVEMRVAAKATEADAPAAGGAR